jgi:hypothetical protein
MPSIDQFPPASLHITLSLSQEREIRKRGEKKMNKERKEMRERTERNEGKR